MRRFWKVTVPTPDDAEVGLWRGAPTDADRDVIVEQYRLYVEMADRISARRSLSNTFFLTLNTVVFTVIAVFWADPPRATAWLALFPVIVLVVQCFAWLSIIRAYRQLSAGKWAVVGAIERRLPASPWWAAEWAALGEGRDPSRYRPLTHLEQWIPVLFAIAYVGSFAVMVLA